MGYPELMRVNITAPLRLVILALYGSDDVTDEFLRIFRRELSGGVLIADDQRFDSLAEIMTYLRALPERLPGDSGYNAIIVVSHGTREGAPTYGETKLDPGPSDELVHNWTFFSSVLSFAGVDRLIVLAICYAGLPALASGLIRGRNQALHVVTAAPGKPFESWTGALAVTRFLNSVAETGKNEYNPEDFHRAAEIVESDYPDTIKFYSAF
jgi:hypothetical protein